MKESYREGVANHPGPEPCEGGPARPHLKRWTGAPTGWVSSSVIIQIPGADAVGMRGKQHENGLQDPRHAEKLHAREPGDPVAARWQHDSGPEGEREKRKVLHARIRGVAQRNSTDEAAEQRRATVRGGCGGKDADQGEHATVYPVPDTELGERAKRAGACASNGTQGWEAEVHRPAAPCDSGPAAGELPQPEKAGGARSGRGEMGRVWTRSGGPARRPGRTNPSWGLSSATVAKSLDSETRRKATTAGDRGAGRQDRPARGGNRSQ